MSPAPIVVERAQSRLVEEEDWTFAGVDTQYMTHGLHPYPARMIPQISRKLINLFVRSKQDVLLDPFMGSGGVLVESLLKGNDAIGVDLNPLAVLIARVKTRPLNPKTLNENARMLLESISHDIESGVSYSPPTIPRLDFWYLPNAIHELAIIRHYVLELEEKDNAIADFFKVCFSLAARKTSNIRNGEFKLYRKRKEDLQKYNPKPLRVFNEIVNSNIAKMREFYETMQGITAEAHILKGNTKQLLEINPKVLHEGSATLVVTSPPYGDSHTTVAYGQYSRYSSLWLGFDEEEVFKVDSGALGGKPISDFNDLESPTLDNAISKVRNAGINAHDETRAREVAAFFTDIDKCMAEIAKALKKGQSHCCFVLGNRTVRRVQLQTDKILIEIGKKYGYQHLVTKYREIPTKTIPWVNAPENIAGKVVETMNKETIVIWKF